MPLNFLVDTGIPIPGPDVQRTTLSLDVTGRFICNTYEKVTTIFLRTPLPPGELNDENLYNRSIETQIDDTGYDFPNRRFRSPLHRTGVIYTFAPAQVRAQKAPGAEGTVSFWNEYRITAQGSRITTWLNGRLVCEGDVPPPPDRARLHRPSVSYGQGPVSIDPDPQAAIAAREPPEGRGEMDLSGKHHN